MFNAWGLTNLRSTRDIDLRGHMQNTVESVEKMFQDLSNLEAEPDGLEADFLMQAFHAIGGAQQTFCIPTQILQRQKKVLES